MTALSRMNDPSNGTSFSWLTASLHSLLWRWELSYLFPQLFLFPPSPLIHNSKCCFSVCCISLSFCRHVYLNAKEVEACDGLSFFFGACLYTPFLQALSLDVYLGKRKSVDGRSSSLIAWLINQLYWLHVDSVLLSEGLMQGPLWAHNDPLAYEVRASSGL